MAQGLMSAFDMFAVFLHPQPLEKQTFWGPKSKKCSWPVHTIPISARKGLRCWSGMSSFTVQESVTVGVSGLGWYGRLLG